MDTTAACLLLGVTLHGTMSAQAPTHVPPGAMTATSAAAQPTASTPYSLYVSSESGNIVTHIEVSPTGWRKVRSVPSARSGGSVHHTRVVLRPYRSGG